MSDFINSNKTQLDSIKQEINSAVVYLPRNYIRVQKILMRANTELCSNQFDEATKTLAEAYRAISMYFERSSDQERIKNIEQHLATFKKAAYKAISDSWSKASKDEPQNSVPAEPPSVVITITINSVRPV